MTNFARGSDTIALFLGLDFAAAVLREGIFNVKRVVGSDRLIQLRYATISTRS